MIYKVKNDNTTTTTTTTTIIIIIIIITTTVETVIWNEVAEAIRVLTRNREVFGSNLDRQADYFNWEFLLFYSTRADKYRNSTSNLARAASIRIHSNS
jgi:hypothetical protein